jgi:hypothetical protein
MRPITQLWIGLATAGAIAGPQHPLALLVGAVAGLLPDLLDEWARALLRQPDLMVAPDPRNPSPAPMADGLRLALRQARATGRPVILRYHPLPDRSGGFTPYRLDYDRKHHLLFSTDGKPAPVYPAAPEHAADEPFTPMHPLPLRITSCPVDLELQACGPRVECRDLDRVAGIGHAWPLAALLAVAAALLAPRLGLTMAAVLSTHLILDAAGRRESRPGIPFSRQTCYGRRLWDETGWRANTIATALAVATLAFLLLTSRP